jgi:hypothetical protein
MVAVFGKVDGSIPQKVRRFGGKRRNAPIIGDFQGSATVSGASVGVPPTKCCANENFT